MRRFAGRTALVTGAGHGIGRAIAHRLAAEGAAVAVADIDLTAARGAATGIAKSSGAASLPIHCDVTDRSAVEAAVAATTGRFGGLDVLVNNVGQDRGTGLDALDEKAWQADADPTLLGAVRCIQASLPWLLASPVGGSVVCIGSVNGLAAFGNLAYSAAKAGLSSLVQNLAVEYGRWGLERSGTRGRPVRFNVVAPGTVRTRVWEDPANGGPARLERLARIYPLGRVGEPEDVAAAVAFLASDDASWITGTVLPVDGGVLAGPLDAFQSTLDEE